MKKKNKSNKYQNLLTTFGQWKDTKTEEKIIEEIYKIRSNKSSKTIYE